MCTLYWRGVVVPVEAHYVENILRHWWPSGDNHVISNRASCLYLQIATNAQAIAER